MFVPITKALTPPLLTDRQVLEDIKQRDIRIETKLSRLLEAQGMTADGRPLPTPPRAYVETMPLDLNLTTPTH